MSLARVLNIKKGDTVSFVGAGGKTSLISFLARELESGFSVAVTTTTRVYPFDRDFFSNIYGTIGGDWKLTKKSLKYQKIPAFFTGLDSDGKCLPLSENEIEQLANMFDVLLIEADGARGCSLKRPRMNEPVIPHYSNKIVWIIGADILGRKFSDELVFKPDLFGEIGLSPDDLIDTSSLRHTLYSPSGYLDKLPGREIYLLINKIDAAPDAMRDSMRLLWHNQLSGLALSGLCGDQRYVEEITNRDLPVTAVILAAGASERFGSKKLIADYHGLPLISRSINAAINSNLKNVIVVLPEKSPELRKVVKSFSQVQIVENSHSVQGLSTSIKAGLERIELETGSDHAMMLLLADMPNVDESLINDVVSGFQNSAAPICAPVENGRFGHPVIFHPVMYPKIRTISGDTGCREIIRTNPDLVKTVVPLKPSTQDDIDTPDDLDRTVSDERFLRIVS